VGFGVRVYGFDPAGQVRRITVSTFEHLFDGANDKTIPEYAGQRIKIAMLFLRTHNRKPISIRRIEYSIVFFDSKGCIDQDQVREEMHMAASSAEWFGPNPRDVLTQLKPSLARLKYRDKFSWIPTREEKQLIERLTLQ
jgi:hypothetical protein